MSCNGARAGILFLLSCYCNVAFRTRIKLADDIDSVSADVRIGSGGSSAANNTDKTLITNGSSVAAMNHSTDVANMSSGGKMVQEIHAQKEGVDKTLMQSVAVAETERNQQSANRLSTLHLMATTAVATDGVIGKVFHGVGYRASAWVGGSHLATRASSDIENINWYIVLAYVVLCCVIYGALVWARPAALDGKLDEKKKVENDLEQEFEDLVGDLELNLQEMTNLELGFIGHAFEDLRRDFCKWVVTLGDHDDEYYHEMLVPLREFIMLWVGAYHDSTFGDQHSAQPLLVSQAALDDCSSVADVCQYVSKTLGRPQRRKSTFSPELDMDLHVGEEDRVAGLFGCSWLQIGGMNPGFYRAEGEPDQDGYPHTTRIGFPCLRVEVTFFSPKHQSLWVAFLLGFVLVAVEIGLGHVVYPAMILVAQLLLLRVLLRFEHDDAETQCVLNINALVKRHDKVDKHRIEVGEAIKKASRVKCLWMYRSLPYLRLLKAIHDKLEDRMYNSERGHETKLDAVKRKAAVHAINAGLRKLCTSLGKKAEWCSGSGMFDTLSSRSSETQVADSEATCLNALEEHEEEACKLIGGRINEAAQFVFEETLMDTVIFSNGVFDVFSIITVRVVACHGLPKYQSLLDKTDPYVRVRIGASSWNKTPTIFNEPDPKWNTENVFFFAPGQRDVAVEVEVMEDHHVRVDKMIGRVNVPFRELSHGEWHHMVLSLDKAKQGTVEIAVKLTSDCVSYISTLEAGQVAQAKALESGCVIGDLTKGICAAGREARGDEATAKYKFGDLTRGVLSNSARALTGDRGKRAKASTSPSPPSGSRGR